MSTILELVINKTYGEHRGVSNTNFATLNADKVEEADVTSQISVEVPAIIDARISALWESTYDPGGVGDDAFDRSNHTGTQLPATIAQDPTNRFVTDAWITYWNAKEEAIGTKGSAFNKDFGTSAGEVSEGDHTHTKDQVGLSLVTNAVSEDLPISDDTQDALDLKADIVTTYLRTQLYTQTESDALLDLKRSITNLYFGNYAGGNYSEFEDDGTLVAIGDAQCWDDLVVDMSAIRLDGSRPPAAEAFRGSLALQFNNGVDRVVYFDRQVPHNYVEGTNLHFHIHTINEVADADDVYWKFTYSWANIGDAFPTETEVYIAITGDSNVDTHTVNEVVSINGTGKRLSSIIMCSLERVGTDALDTSSEDILLIGADFHHLIDTFGSRQEYLK